MIINEKSPNTENIEALNKWRKVTMISIPENQQMHKITIWRNQPNVEKIAQANKSGKTTLEKIAEYHCSTPWSPIKWTNNYRNKKNFESCDLLVLDVDDGLTIEAAKKLFSPYKIVISTTKSHQIEKTTGTGVTKAACDRFRILIPLSREITSREEYETFMRGIVAKYSFVDQSTWDAARFFYPSVEVVWEQDGNTFDVDSLLNELEAAKAKKLAEKFVSAIKNNGGNNKYNQVVKLLYKLPLQMDYSDYTAACFAVLHELGIDKGSELIKRRWKDSWDSRNETQLESFIKSESEVNNKERVAGINSLEKLVQKYNPEESNEMNEYKGIA